MTNSFLADRLKGQWIVQSINYPSLESSNYKSAFVDQIEWIYIKDLKHYWKFIMQYLEKQDELSEVDLYHILSQSSSSGPCKTYYVALIYAGSRLKSLIKLDEGFALLNRFTVKNQSRKQLTIASNTPSITVVEKIYFLNRNLKVIKSTIREGNACKGVSFSSEIRIGQ